MAKADLKSYLQQSERVSSFPTEDWDSLKVIDLNLDATAAISSIIEDRDEE